MARSRSRRGRGPFGFISSLNTLAYLPLATRAPTYGRLVFSLLRDDRIPWSNKAVLGVAAAYLVSPIDLVPEFIPLLGALDDVAIIVLALDVFLESIPRSLLDEKLRELEIDAAELDADLQSVRRYVPKPIRRLALRLPSAFATVGDLAERSGLDRRLRSWLQEDEARVRRARPVGGSGARSSGKDKSAGGSGSSRSAAGSASPASTASGRKAGT